MGGKSSASRSETFNIRGDKRFLVHRVCIYCRQDRFTDRQVRIIADPRVTLEQFVDSKVPLTLHRFVCDRGRCANRYSYETGALNWYSLAFYFNSIRSEQNLATPDKGLMRS